MSIPATRRACRQFLLLLLSAVVAGAASAATITCVPGPVSSNAAFNWVRRISIDEHSRTVNMDIVRSRTKDTETMGKMRAELVGMDDSSGDPVYVFNSIPTLGVEVTHLFKLFKAGDWRLISAGVTFVNKTPALRAIDPGVVFDCKRSDMG